MFMATNAAGGAQLGMTPGSIMVIRDHINGLKRSALAGSFMPQNDTTTTRTTAQSSSRFDCLD